MKIKNLIKDKRGVFGLTAVQTFFSIILGLAILAYVIIAVMGTLGEASIIPKNTLSGTSVNESLAKAITAGVTLTTGSSTLDGACGAVTRILNQTGNFEIGLGNITQTNCVVTNTSGAGVTYGGTNWLYSYPYTYSISSVGNARNIMTNTSTGITSFFGAINPVYAILAILVIILVLVVLVRVVQAPSGSSASREPSL